MNKKKKNIPGFVSFFSTVNYCIKLSWKASKFHTLFRLIGLIITPICNIISAYLLKYIIDLLSGSWDAENKKHTLITLILLMFTMTLITTIVQKILLYCQTIHSEMVRKQITIQLMNKTVEVDLEYFDNPEYYNKISAASRDSSSIINILWNVLECISSFITFIGAFVVLCSSNAYYGIAVLLAAFPSSIVGAKFTKSLCNLSIDQLKGERKKSYIQDITLSRKYAQDVRLYGMGNYLKDRYIDIWQYLFNDRKKILKKRSLIISIFDILPIIVQICIAIDISFRIFAGNATVGDYTLYAGLAGQLCSSIFTLSSSGLQIYDDKLRINNIKTLDNLKNKVINIGFKRLEKVKTIEFCGVSFCYPGRKDKVLDNISFKIDNEEKVAIVGVNGSGKSTLIKLLLRLYDVDSGIIRINSIDIREFDIDSLRSNFSVYFQEMLNYSFTLRENIKVADIEREDGDEPILQAINESCSDDILNKTPEKLDSYISRIFEEDGIELSVGQHQKIAIARTFYRRHTALILDEPSSSMDPEAEHDIFEALCQLSAGKTVLFTSHRLSNIGLADRIIVLEHGRVIEQGTQTELLNNSNRFAKLYKYQQDKFMEVI